MTVASLGVHTAVVPSGGGWRYEQRLSDGSYQRIPVNGCAGTPEELVKQVRDFRAANLMDLGDPVKDVAEYIKRVSPMNDRFPGRKTAPEPVNKRAIRPLMERAKDWLLEIGPRHPRLLIEDEAQARADICAKCPQNVEWRVKCAPCNSELILRGRHVRQRIEYPRADALKACRLHGHYLPTAVFIDRDNLGGTHEQAPDKCWMRTEAKPEIREADSVGEAG